MYLLVLSVTFRNSRRHRLFPNHEQRRQLDADGIWHFATFSQISTCCTPDTHSRNRESTTTSLCMHHRLSLDSLNDCPSKPQEPLILNFWVVRVICLLMILLGIALQIVLFFSETQNGMCMNRNAKYDSCIMAIGFPVPAKNVFSFVSIQTLTVNTANRSISLFGP